MTHPDFAGLCGVVVVAKMQEVIALLAGAAAVSVFMITAGSKGWFRSDRATPTISHTTREDPPAIVASEPPVAEKIEPTSTTDVSVAPTPETQVEAPVEIHPMIAPEPVVAAIDDTRSAPEASEVTKTAKTKRTRRTPRGTRGSRRRKSKQIEQPPAF